MTTKCWLFQGEGYDNALYEFFACGTNASYGPSGYGVGQGLYMDGVRIAGDGYFYKPGASVSEYTTYPLQRTPGRNSGGDCSGCLSAAPPPPPITKYDCLNGQCIAQSTYNTPGLFADLGSCQAKCSLASNNCDGQCITNEEYSQIQSAIAQQQKDCS